jgi:hypothetical protein
MDVKQSVLLALFALLSRNIQLSHQTSIGRTNAQSSQTAPSTDVKQQPAVRSATDVSSAARPESGKTDASSLNNLGWHLGGRPVSTSDLGSQRHRRHVDGILAGADNARSGRIRRQLLQQQQQKALGGHRQPWTSKGAAKRIKHEWDDSVLAWIKRNNGEDQQQQPSGLHDLKFLGGATHGGRGVAATGTKPVHTKTSGTDFADEEKRRWDEADLAWLKRSPLYSYNIAADGDSNNGEELTAKRNWDDSVLTWIKRTGGSSVGGGVEAVAGRKSQGERALERPLVPSYHEKRMWDDHEMAWLKRNAK